MQISVARDLSTISERSRCDSMHQPGEARMSRFALSDDGGKEEPLLLDRFSRVTQFRGNNTSRGVSVRWWWLLSLLLALALGCLLTICFYQHPRQRDENLQLKQHNQLLQTEIEKSHSENVGLKQINMELETQRDTAHTERNELLTEHQAMKHSHSKLEESIKGLKTQVSGLEAKTEELTGLLIQKGE